MHVVYGKLHITTSCGVKQNICLVQVFQGESVKHIVYGKLHITTSCGVKQNIYMDLSLVQALQGESVGKKLHGSITIEIRVNRK